MSEKKRFALYIDSELLDRAAYCAGLDGSKSKCEFIANAIRFYCGFLEQEISMDYLPKALAGMLEGYLDQFSDRMGSLLFKNAVEQAMCNHMIAADSDLTPDTLDKLRARCVNDVKRTNGRISFKEILKFQKDL